MADSFPFEFVELHQNGRWRKGLPVGMPQIETPVLELAARPGPFTISGFSVVGPVPDGWVVHSFAIGGSPNLLLDTDGDTRVERTIEVGGLRGSGSKPISFKYGGGILILPPNHATLLIEVTGRGWTIGDEAGVFRLNGTSGSW